MKATYIEFNDINKTIIRKSYIVAVTNGGFNGEEGKLTLTLCLGAGIITTMVLNYVPVRKFEFEEAKQRYLKDVNNLKAVLL